MDEKEIAPKSYFPKGQQYPSSLKYRQNVSSIPNKLSLAAFRGLIRKYSWPPGHHFKKYPVCYWLRG